MPYPTTMNELSQYTQPDPSLDNSRLSGFSYNLLPLNDAVESPHAWQSEYGQIRKRGRKGHCKSRTGCFNCKKARIKCKENRPNCDYCVHRGLQCEWPEIQINQVGVVIRNPMSGLAIPATPQTEFPGFTMQDFRFFNHFLSKAYPYHPVGNDWAWTHDIPSLAFNYDFLLHAMLALGASDLASPTEDPDFSMMSIMHRVKSIASLKKAVAVGITSWEQGNAMLATCFTLLFQSMLLDDGLADYIAFLRGVVTIGMNMGQKKMRFVFKKLFGREYLDSVGPALSTLPLLKNDFVSRACRSLETIAPLCKTKAAIGIYGLLLSIARNLVTSSQESYVSLRNLYGMFMMMPQEEYREFTDPSNEVSQLLQAHFVALQLIMTPITRVDWGQRIADQSYINEGRTGRWLETLHKTIPPHLLQYYEWTLWVEKATNSGAIYDGWR